MRPIAIILLVCLAVTTILPADATEPSEILDDPVLEARARALSKNIRCLVCQNQSIDDSNASLARDLRVIVRERLVAGDTDRQIEEFLVERYGDFVLLKPPMKPTTYALWYGPAGVFVIGLLAAAVFFRRGRKATTLEPLDPDEQARIQRLIKEQDEGQT